MAKVGRNDPCPCGSGKKYKQCHLPIEQAAEAERRALRETQDRLLPRMLEAVQSRVEIIPEALRQFWDGRYSVEQIDELDSHEDRGSERFLTWVLFDYQLPDGRTLAATLADAPDELEPDARELQLLEAWRSVRLRPYVVEDRVKGQSIRVHDLLDGTTHDVTDHAASRRVEPGEVLVGHLVPVAGTSFIAGTAAHLTDDTRDKLVEFAELHLEAFRRTQPDASWADLLRDRSAVLNHFVMQLPTEHNPSVLDDILVNARAALALTGESLGKRRDTSNDGSEDDAA